MISVERIAHILLNVLIAGLLILAVTASRHYRAAPASPAASLQIPAGTNFNLPGIGNDFQIVVAVSTTCEFCSQSAPFYGRLVL